MLKVEHVSKNYGLFKTIRDISFSLKRGEVLGLLGANGTGKSTTLNMLAGFFPPTSGKISFEDFDISEKPLEYKKRLGYLPEFPPLYPDMTIIEQLDMVCSFKGVPSGEKKEEITRVCAQTGISALMGRPIRTMSKGYRQRTGLAQALIGRPGLIILDEPVNGLDPQQIIDIRELIKKLGKEHAVIVSSHILSEISSVATRIMVLNNGTIAADSPVKELINCPPGEIPVLCVRISGPKTSVLKIIGSISGVRNIETFNCPEDGCMDYNIITEKDIRKELSAALCGKQHAVMQMRMKTPTLEEIFIELTAGHKSFSGSAE